MGTMAPRAEVPQYNSEILRRQTRGGRTLWYKLTVLQEPERARACGAGTRANSDRRPVDPPPVVELKIHEGGNCFEAGNDITFDYNASFFLYASLEQSRKVIRGRVPGQPNPPILTGVPASGMAYLDRPNAAGYFIFPDLSVRHEGYYNLSFSLFETTKDERDLDFDMSDDLPPGVDWRMDIKTNPFEVYSAKKFPGLKESTDLSKQVAEQGCRVRIRREIRMRKRDNKGTARGRREEEISARRTVTPCEDPNAAAARARSLSNSSEQRPVYPQDPQRRPSDPHGPPPPGPPAYSHPSSGYLAFGQAGAQYPAPHAPAPPQNLPAMSPGHATPYGRSEPQGYGYARPESAGHQLPRPRELHPSPSPIMKSEPQHYSNYSLHSPTYSNSSSYARRDSQVSSYPTTPSSSHGLSKFGPNGTTMPPPPPSRDTMSIGAIMSNSQSSQHLAPIEADTYPRPPSPSYNTGNKRPRESAFPEAPRSLQDGARPQDSKDPRRSSYYVNCRGENVRVQFNEMYHEPPPSLYPML